MYILHACRSCRFDLNCFDYISNIINLNKTLLYLQFLEGLNLCMVVGLAVDYVVHLAEGYTHSLHSDRLSRVRDMLEEMGASVFYGACTTLGAAAFMFLTKLTFFKQFGIFMFATLGFSFVFSMGLFVTLLGLIGPENETGNVMALFRKCCRRKSRQ